MEKENENVWLLRSLFPKRSGNRNDGYDDVIPILCPIANSVVSRCSKIISIPTKELLKQFEITVPDNMKQQPRSYARNLVEFYSYRALHHCTTRPNYLSDKEFRRLTFDMMIAWEAPDDDCSSLLQRETAPSPCDDQEVEGEDGWSMFFSNSTRMAVQVDEKRTVGPEAFARIAPACPIIADIMTVHNLFDVLTSSTGHRLHFIVYQKYLQTLEKIVKTVQSTKPQVISTLSLVRDEIILDVGGTIPTKPVLQHNGMSAWPGRLTLTNYALYFEPGVGLFDKPVKYDLATDMKQVIKPELTGPLGTRLFDKAVMYKSIAKTEPVYLEFPEFRGCSRRDYWLDISLEILRAHRFIRKYNLKGNQQYEALARAILGILRFRAIREGFGTSSVSNYGTLLCFNLGESLPGGDQIMETLSSRLRSISHDPKEPDALNSKRQVFPNALLTISRLKILTFGETSLNIEAAQHVGDVSVGELNPLETIVKKLKRDTVSTEAAQATVDQVKIEGIDSNLAVMKELLLPLSEAYNRLQQLASWSNPYKSLAFVFFVSYVICRGWINYILPSSCIISALVMFWRRCACKRKPLNSFKIVAPPYKNAVEQLLTLQDVLSQAESAIRSANITLLKLRAILFSVAPKATETVILLLMLMALVIVILPLNYIMLLSFVEYFTRNMPMRKESNDRWLRRVREWWIRIPVAPVHLVKSDDKKRK